VAAALAVLPTGSRVVLVHDAARPLASPELLSRLIKAGRRQAAVPGLPVSDAVWKAAAGRCERPVARDGMFQVQTPQAFPVRVIRAAYASGRTGGGRADDDAALARRAGFPVRLLPGEPTNFKITYPADLAAAEAFLRARPKPGQKGKGRCLTR